MTAVRAATFTGLDPYKLTGVTVTERKVGDGSYGTVLELDYIGLKCAGKKIHEDLLKQGDASYSVRRFEEECRLLSQARHPNIVQFLGVYFQPEVRAPILVMEFLPTNLTSCIEKYGILPKEIGYSLLHEVALGLCYLHSQTPPIIHRDLSSNNILLTPNMTAKIADLGVARILNLSPLQVSHMTETPGTPIFMPPEVMVANPKYDTSVDTFSFGIMMIHMFSGQWPAPQVGPNRTEPDGRMIPVSEAERREVFLRAVGNDHPLIDLILKCIYNHPESRAHASEIVERLAEMVLQFPASFANRLDEALRQNKRLTEENKQLLVEKGLIKAPNKENGELIRQFREEIERKNSKVEELETEIELLKTEIKTAELSLRNISHVDITWNQCAELPKNMAYGTTVVINGKVYCGAVTADKSDQFIVYCYDASQDKWTTLPQLPVRSFGLGQVNGKLVAVGGTATYYKGGNDVYTFDERSRRWKQTIPRMPTARWSPGVLSLQSALVVAGGRTSLLYHTAAVEIFKPRTSQWYRTDPLPTACRAPSLVTIDNTCYALGGYQRSPLNQALCASVDDLLGNAVPGNQTSNSSGSRDTCSAWKTLPNTPTYRPAAAVLDDKLLAVGALKTSDSERGAQMNEVHVYSPSTNSWIYVSDLPGPQEGVAVAVMSSKEILVIGGYLACNDRVNAVYKGTLQEMSS